MKRNADLAPALAEAARAVARVGAGRSLDDAFERRAGRGALLDLCYGTLRRYGRVQAIVQALSHKGAPEPRVQALLWCALYALDCGRYAEYTVVDQAVRACALLEQWPARGYVNGMLRGYLRSRGALERRIAAEPQARYQHPQWWIDSLQRAYPERWGAILEAGNTHPPMCLRINRRRTDQPSYLQQLAQAGIAACPAGAHGLLLDKPVPVERLPGFDQGLVSVQDAGAQHCAAMLGLRDGQRVLDACAAPGGKSAQLLESAEIRLLALDSDAARAARIGPGLARLGLEARVQIADCTARHRGGTGSRSTACWPTFPVPRRASRAAIPTSSGCAAPTMLPPSRGGRRRFSMRFGGCSPRVVNCCMSPARCFRRRTAWCWMPSVRACRRHGAPRCRPAPRRNCCRARSTTVFSTVC